jgi:4-amino-4-deoxy-L-arabinose transferase-like glycosyltransferase
VFPDRGRNQQLNSKKLHRIGRFLLPFLLIIFAFLFSIYSGRRGIHPLDQPIVFDGAYRILSGQTIYNDFQAPVGPVTFMLQALVFRIFGISWNIMIATAAICNAAAAILVVRIVGIFTDFSKFYSYLAGFLTAVWFYPPFGTIYMEQTALLFGLCSIWGILESSITKRELMKRSLLIIAGGSFALAILSKQNIGLFLVLPVVIVFSMTWRNTREALFSIPYFLMGFLLPMIIFGFYLYSSNTLDQFKIYVLEIPSDLGLRRLFRISRIILRFSTSIYISVFSLILILMNVAIILFKKITKDARKSIFAAVLSISLIITQQLSILSARNQAENYLGLIGLVITLTFAFFQPLIIPLFNWSRKIFTKDSTRTPDQGVLNFYNLGVIVISGVIFVFGINISTTRVVHDYFADANFNDALDIPGMEWVRWGPQYIQGQIVKAEDIEGVYQYLLDTREQFYVFPEYAFFYGILGVPSPQPLLWFHKGLTFNNSNRQLIDEMIVEGLISNDIEIIVLSSAVTPGSENLLKEFTNYERVIAEDFEQIAAYGIFQIYKLKNSRN